MTPQEAIHERFMRMALDEAHRALEADEVPIGAVVVCTGTGILYFLCYLPTDY